MVLTCGLSNYSLSLFHLVNHAFFKALLFLTCGLVIHALFDEQDIRKMGGLILKVPAAYIFMLIASLALIGFPFCAGYYSKDLIIENLYLQQTVITNFVYYISIITAMLTTFYSTRLLFFVFFGPVNGFKRVYLNLHTNNFFIILILTILLIGSIFSGYFLKEIFIGVGSNFFSLSILTKNTLFGLDYEFLPFFIKLLPTIFSLGICAGTYGAYSFIFYYTLIRGHYKFISVYNFFANSWYFDKFFNFCTTYIFYYSYQYIFKLSDKGLLEIIGPYGLFKMLGTSSKELIKFHDGFLYNYIIIFLFSTIILLSIFL
jgi:NADH-ubiquinone oxidoreductase chain 5